ncbi:MAG: hypothetical protein AAB176_01660 [Pseudomonadota bacterium]
MVTIAPVFGMTPRTDLNAHQDSWQKTDCRSVFHRRERCQCVWRTDHSDHQPLPLRPRSWQNFGQLFEREKEMSAYTHVVLIAASLFITLPALASENCSQLPDALQAIPVMHISQSSELNSLDDKLDSYLRPCLSPVTEQNKKAICANGKLAGEQALRVIARLDHAGARNPFLAKAKVKSYATALKLLDHMKHLHADATCV